jgi:hypothetical protein
MGVLSGLSMNDRRSGIGVAKTLGAPGKTGDIHGNAFALVASLR